MGRWIGTGLVAATAAAAWVAVAIPALGHGGRLPFDAWGGFAGGLLRCQRVIARAAAQCAAEAWAARRACRQTALGGGTCDETATAARIAGARRGAQDAVDAACSERQAISLQFLGSFDLQQDLIGFCRDWERAADAAAFAAPGATAAACATATAAAVSDVMRYALGGRQRAMDRIAASPAGDARRPALLENADRRLARAVDQAAARLAARCPDFADHYRRPPRDLLAALATRAACLGGAFYIQDRVLCPPPVCGNGIVEPNEDCDDGNTADGDACPAGCAR